MKPKCRNRLVLWLVLAASSICAGAVADFTLRTGAFPVWLRLLGLAGMVLVYFPLKRTARLLKRLGESEDWGCTTRLVTTDIYRCMRHPHHAGVGMFMTCMGLLIGHWWSLLVITAVQWTWVMGFLYLVEERELAEKFGEEYRAYSRRVPMLFANPVCVLRVLLEPLELPKT
jgi:protein-S-isoprenylcysteine O-methyltransferase Ste14